MKNEDMMTITLSKREMSDLHLAITGAIIFERRRYRETEDAETKEASKRQLDKYKALREKIGRLIKEQDV